ncbi:hypothetical protein [Tannerella sp.]|uniref:hypothetical protein n=1 Tax=Tannerella sp. TaxID=2382127 RepID=UPI0026DAF7A3|nr:hypothetical protein [Tannerella sp.]MDO4703413.1 hypothetical protein [Tannerella sp.]
MFSAIFYKEWIKTRRTVLLVFLLLVALLGYALVQMGQTLRVSGAVQAWSAVLLKDMSLVPAVTKWFPLLAGLLLGVAQFIPEMTDKRLKLTLHLPLREWRIIFATLLYGIAVLSVAFLLMYAGLYAGLSRHYAAEMLHAVTWQLLPYFEGGLACYLFTAWVCLEPVWRRRVANALVASAGLYLYFMDAPSGAYITFLPCLTLILVAGLSFPFYSAARFKDGSPG